MAGSPKATKLTINTLAKVRVLDALDAADKVLNDSILMTGLTPNNLPQLCGLHKVLVLDLASVGSDVPSPFLVFRVQSQRGCAHALPVLVKLGRLNRRANVVGILAVVVGEVHEAVALERTVDGLFGCVGWQHLVIGAETVAGSVWVGEHASLEHYLFHSVSLSTGLIGRKLIDAHWGRQMAPIPAPYWMARMQIVRYPRNSCLAVSISENTTQS